MSDAGTGPASSYAGGLDVLATKLARPRVPGSFVPRPHVDDQLTTGSAKPLTVVSAGAGWGKTLTVSNWAAGQDRPTGWVSLDPHDNEVGRFWSCVIAALLSAGAISAADPLATLVPRLGSPVDNFRRLSGGLASLSSDVVLVLDDFHLVTDLTVLAELDDLLRNPIPQLHLMLLTRADPALHLHRLRLTEDLTEVRPRDLAFGVAEATELLAAHDMPVAPADAEALVGRTEGWPAGLRLAALFLGSPGSDRTVRDFAGDDRAVSTYLAEEVLTSLDPDLRSFLLRTSVAERLSSGLAEVLSDQAHSQQQLERLEESNTFVVSIGPGRRWFRYHALLREMLHHRLLVDDPDLVPELHRRAAGWYGEHGYPVEALRHAADAEDWTMLGELFVTQAVPLLVSVERSSLADILGRIPAERLADTQALILCAAARTFLDGRFEEMQVHLDLVAEQLGGSAGRDHAGTTLAFLALSTPPARARGDIHATIGLSRAALTCLAGEAGSLPAAPAYRAIALSNLGMGLLWSGDVTGARQCLQEGLTVSDAAGVEATTINVLSHLALAATVSGDLEEGRRHADAAVELVESRGWDGLPQSSTAYLALAMMALERNEVARAQELLDHGKRIGSQEPVVRWACAVAQARLRASEGKVEAARTELRSLPSEISTRADTLLLVRWAAIAEAEVNLLDDAAGTPARPIVPTLDREPPYVVEQTCVARWALATGDLALAEDALRPLRAADEGGSALIGVWLATALVADRKREDSRALEALRRAVSQASTLGVRRPFTTVDPEALTRLLTRLTDLSPELTGTVDGLLADIGRGRLRGPAAQALSEPLTDRELSVLQFLPTMMTNNEIGAELYVSVNTVKAHLKQIFRKLDVPSRRLAVQRGRELGLLDARDDQAAPGRPSPVS